MTFPNLLHCLGARSLAVKEALGQAALGAHVAFIERKGAPGPTLFKAPVQASSVLTFCSGGNQLYRLLRRSRPGCTRCCGMICAWENYVKWDICKPSKQQLLCCCGAQTWD